MISFSNADCKQQLIELYNHCFPGEQTFCNWFFSEVYKCENTLVYMENGQLLGMLQMLPTELQYGDQNIKASYLYALGTHKLARGKGIMSKLIQRASQLATERGHKALTLITENDSLFEYYAQYGFKPAFSISKKQCMPYDLPEGFSISTLSEKDCCKVNSLYSTACQGVLYGIRDKVHYKTLLELYKNGAWALNGVNGEIVAYAFGQKQGDALFATECVGDYAQQLMAGLAKKLSCCEAGWSGIPSVDNNRPQGSILCLEPIELPEHSYLNLMFN